MQRHLLDAPRPTIRSVEESQGGCTHCRTIAERARRMHGTRSIGPVLASADTLEHPGGPRAIPSAPGVAVREPGREQLRLKRAMGKKHLRDVDGHLCVVGPPELACGTTSYEPPEESLEWTTFVRRSERVPDGKTEDAA